MENDSCTEKRILLLGGGGHCRSILDSLISIGDYDKIGIIDNNWSAAMPEIPVVGTDEDLSGLKEAGWLDAFIAVGSVGSTGVRRKLYNLVKELGFRIPCIVDPSAVIARDVTIQEGVFVGKRAVINVGARIGHCAIINSGAIVEHDCSIGDFTHISPGATLCGQVIIGSDSHIGAGSIIRQGILIGNSVLVGMGSVVVKDVADNVTAYGNPCKVVN